MKKLTIAVYWGFRCASTGVPVVVIMNLDWDIKSGLIRLAQDIMSKILD